MLALKGGFGGWFKITSLTKRIKAEDDLEVGGAPGTVKHFRSEIRNKSGNTPVLPPVRLVPFPFLEGPPSWNSQSWS